MAPAPMTLDSLHKDGGAEVMFHFAGAEGGWCRGRIEKKYYPLNNAQGYTHWIHYDDGDKFPHALSLEKYEGHGGDVGAWIVICLSQSASVV